MDGIGITMIIFKIFTKYYSCLCFFDNPDMSYCLGFYVANCLVISLDTIAMKIYIRWSTSFDVECGCMEKCRFTRSSNNKNPSLSISSQELREIHMKLCLYNDFLVKHNYIGRRRNFERFTGYCIFLPITSGISADGTFWSFEAQRSPLVFS